MKKKKLLIPLAIMALSISAAGLAGCKDEVELSSCETHVDADSDGLCDVCGEKVEIPATKGTVTINPSSNGTVTADKTSYSIGDAVTLTVTPKADYKLKKLTVNGADRTADVADGKLVLSNVQETALSVFATFEANEVSFTVSVKGHKRNEELSLAGATLTLSDGGAGEPYTAEVDGEGKATFRGVKVGNYTLAAENYLGSSVKVDAGGATAEVTLEYDTFKDLLGWGSFDFSKQNDDTAPEIGLTNDCAAIFTNDAYDEVMASVYLNGSGFASGNTGILFRFVGEGMNDVVTVRMEGRTKIQFSKHDLWKNYNPKTTVEMAEGTDWQDLIFFETTGDGKADVKAEEYLAAYDAGTLKLSVVRKGATFYVLLNDTYIGQRTFNEKYENAKCEAGFLAESLKDDAGTIDAKNWKRWKVEVSENIPELKAKAQITVEKPDDEEAATANVTADKDADGTYDFGTEITLTVTKPVGYKLESLLVNGVDLATDVKNGELKITANRAEMEIKAKFAKEEPIALNLTVKGKKLGSTAVLEKGTVVTFKGTDYTFTVGENGTISAASVAKGKYTVSATGYLEQQIAFDETVTEIVLESDTFKEILGWGNFDLSKQNAETPEFGITNDCSVILTKETYDSVKATIYLKGENMTAGNAGLVFRFVGDGFNEKGETVTLIMQGTKKIQFSQSDLWGNSTVAAGNKWNNLLYFQNIYDDDADRTADEKAAEYLDAYSKGTLELSVVRKGTTFYAFLGDRLIGMQTVDAKYANAKCEVGFISEQLGDTTAWKRWKVKISEDVTLPSVTVSDKTAADANGLIAVSPEKIHLGDTVTIAVAPGEGYILDNLTVSGGATVTSLGNNQYSFLATETEYTVTATFKVAPVNEAQATVSGIGLNNSAIDMNGMSVVFTPAEGAATTLEVKNGKVKGVLAAGTYTVSVEGYYDIAGVTVDANGDLEQGEFVFSKVIFGYNLLGEGYDFATPSEVDNTHAAKDGYVVTTKDTKYVYEFTVEAYKDIAFSIVVKKSGATSPQGIIMREFDPATGKGTQRGLRFRIEPQSDTQAKVQWWGGEWGWGIQTIADKWDFGSGEDYANPLSKTLFDKFNGDGLTLTLVRKGSTVYALVDGKIYATTELGDWSDKYFQFAICSENAAEGYQIPFKIEDADAVLARAGAAVGTDLTAYAGSWTAGEGTLAVSGRGYAEFKAAAGTVKESATFKLSAANANSDQGIMYRFADGKYIAIRYQNNGGNYKVQYTMDTILFGDASLKNWQDFMMTDDEKTAFDGAGIDLAFIRDGKTFYVLLGGKLLDTATLEDKYADMEGTMALMIWEGKNAAFSCEHKTGDEVTIPSASDESGTQSEE